jgi:hypothetical protein
VDVQDNTPPTMTCENITAIAGNACTSTATFDITVADNCDKGTITPSCNATTDVTEFPVGVNKVVCTADDADNNEGW